MIAIGDVVTVNVALMLPAGTVTEGGTLTEELLLDNATVTPPAGAGLAKLTVPVNVVPPWTLAGLNETLNHAPAGMMVSAAALLAPSWVAEIVAVTEEPTDVVATVKVAAVFPAPTSTEEGTVAKALSLDNATATPPAGAASLKVTVPVEAAPPNTLDGFSDTDAGVTPWPAVNDNVTVEFAPIETLSCNCPP